MLNSYREVRVLGTGSFGTVHLVNNTGTDEFLARKVIEDVVDILVGVRELDVLYNLRSLQNPNLVGIRDYSIKIDKDKYITEHYLEYCSGGSMDSLLEEEFEKPDFGINPTLGDVDKRLTDLMKIMAVLNECQQRGVYHLDIKTENILYKSNHEVCLCDFSNYIFNNPWKENVNPPRTCYEALLYRPLEVALLRTDWEVIRKADVWAMGIVALELLGCWEFIMKLDERVTSRVSKLTSLISKSKNLQNSLLKRQHGKTGMYAVTTPIHKSFLANILPSSPISFGSKITDEGSMDYAYLWGLVISDEVRNLDFNHLYETSVAYFKLLKSSSWDSPLLKKMILEIIPRMLTIKSTDRIDFSQCLSEMGYSNKFERGRPVTQDVEDTGTFYRIPDPIWHQCFKDYYQAVSDMYITYGADSVKYPVQAIVYTKCLFEHVCEILMSNVDDYKKLFPEKSSERLVFYNQLLRACVLISSEMFDFIFPCISSGFFNGEYVLEKISPFIKLVVELTVGNLTGLRMNSMEEDIVRGISNLVSIIEVI